MTDVNLKSTGEEPAATAQAGYDFSNVRGLQLIGANIDAGETTTAWRDGLKLELEARAERLCAAVDQSIVLASDGTIRWLGDPVAKLLRGADLLAPETVILANAELPKSARDAVAARIRLWLTATIRRLLGPLLALRELPNEPPQVQEIADKLAKALGVMEREPVRSQIQALDQVSRAALRKHGVRFGAYYVFIPVLLKPAARTLALQLWDLQAPSFEADGSLQTLMSLTSSGRTSLPPDPLIGRDCYRVAGFRRCGDRVVRVDILERLADLIRGSVLHRAAKGAPSTGDCEAVGFVVSGQMTSLVGCSGEGFASVLRSLGYESLEVKRGDLVEVEVEAEKAAEPDRADADDPETSPKKAEPETEAALPVVHHHETNPEPLAEGDGQCATSILSVDKDDSDPSETNGDPSEESSEAVPETSSGKAVGEASPSSDLMTLWRRVRRAPAKRGNRRGVAADGAETRPNPLRRDRGKEQGSREAPKKEKQVVRPERRDPIRQREAEAVDSSNVASRKKPSARYVRPGISKTTQSADKVNLNSPFAKLLELRALLENETKNKS